MIMQRGPSLALMQQSTLYQLLAEKLGDDPVADIGKRRQRGESWRTIDRAYLVEYGVSVTDATLRAWYKAATDAQPA